MNQFDYDEFSQTLKQLALQDAGALSKKIEYHFSAPGKLVRAKLNFDILKVLNVSNDNAYSWALITEMIHNASLIHDDLQDEDFYRRNQESYWNRFGKNSAINAGDYLIARASLLVEQMQVTDQVKWRLNRILMQTIASLSRGQELEEELKSLPMEALWGEYLTCIEEKTASLFLMAILAAEVMEGQTEASGLLRDAFLRFGTCFQLHDDLLDILGDKGREQKANDLREGKWSSIVIRFLEVAEPSKADAFRRFLLKPRFGVENDEVLLWLTELQKSGVIQDSLSFLQQEIFKLNETILLSPHTLQTKMNDLVKSSFYLKELNS